jgi:hypothetical protein
MKCAAHLRRNNKSVVTDGRDDEKPRPMGIKGRGQSGVGAFWKASWENSTHGLVSRKENRRIV